MKKNLFLPIAFFIAFSGFSQGPVKIIKAGDNNILNDSTIYLYGSTANELTETLFIVNPVGVSQYIYARRDSLSWVAGSANCICWGGFCYDDTVSLSPSYQTIKAYDTAKGTYAFDGDYTPHGFAGKTTIRYTFYNSVHKTDSSWIIVVFEATPTGIQNITEKAISFSNPYPNPTSNFVSFTYSLNTNVSYANLKVFNMLGECVQNIPVNAAKNKITLDVQSMPSGIYFCEMESEGCAPAYQKLVVAH